MNEYSIDEFAQDCLRMHEEIWKKFEKVKAGNLMKSFPEKIRDGIERDATSVAHALLSMHNIIDMFKNRE